MAAKMLSALIMFQTKTDLLLKVNTKSTMHSNHAKSTMHSNHAFQPCVLYKSVNYMSYIVDTCVGILGVIEW